MDKFLVSLDSCGVRAEAQFKTPILSWGQDITRRYFEAIYAALDDTLVMKPEDFVITAGSSLGNCSAALHVLGTNSALTLRPDCIVASFPTVDAESAEYVNSIVRQGYSAVLQEFDNVEVESVSSSVGYHFVGGDARQLQGLIAASTSDDFVEKFTQYDGVEMSPAMRFKLVSKDGKWNAHVAMEASAKVESGIYLYREIALSDLSDLSDVESQVETLNGINALIFESVGLVVQPKEDNANKR